MLPWYSEILACPVDQSALKFDQQQWVCAHQHAYPQVDGVPVFLIPDIEQTLHVADASLAQAWAGPPADPWYLETLGLSLRERSEILALAQTERAEKDPVVSYLIGATNGIAYRHLRGNLEQYPIPSLRLPAGAGKTFLDVGCNWGRWSIAAARKGYRVIGVDPSLGAVMAARRVCQQLGVQADFIVADARHLPFRARALDTVFSYSVLQHFSRPDVAKALSEVGRVLQSQGTSQIQMPLRWGVRCLYHQVKRRFAEGSGFDVRYYGWKEISRLFSLNVGATTASVDCYLGIGLQASDWRWMSLKGKIGILISEGLRWVSRWFAPLRWVADSVYLTSRKAG